MPIFGSHREPSPEVYAPERTIHHDTTTKKHGLFHRTSRRGLTGGGSLLHKAMGRNDDVDPSILQARERVMDAEVAEEQADRALDQARLRVREAREHVKRIEAEAAEEARRAKIKQQHAREVTKRGKGLGRKCFCSCSCWWFVDILLMNCRTWSLKEMLDCDLEACSLDLNTLFGMAFLFFLSSAVFVQFTGCFKRWNSQMCIEEALFMNMIVHFDNRFLRFKML